MDSLQKILTELSEHIDNNPDHPPTCPVIDEALRRVRRMLTPEELAVFCLLAIELSRF